MTSADVARFLRDWGPLLIVPMIVVLAASGWRPSRRVNLAMVVFAGAATFIALASTCPSP